MEIRGEYTAKLFAPAADAPQTKPAQEQPAEKKQRQDKLELSQQAAQQRKEPLAKKREEAREANALGVLSPNAKEDPQEDDFLVMSRCQKIAARILKGDTVPQKDHRYLQENQPGLYRIAIMMKRKNDDPESHKTLVEDEKHQKQLALPELSSGSCSASAATAPTQTAESTATEE